MHNFSRPFSAMHQHTHLISFITITRLLQSHCRSAAVLLSLFVRCLGLLLVLLGREALLHPRGACRMAEGAAHVSVTLCGPAGNGIAAAPPEACSGRRLAVVRSALPPFWHCCHHWLVAMESCQLGWQPLVGLNLVSSLRALKNRKDENQKFFHLNLCQLQKLAATLCFYYFSLKHCAASTFSTPKNNLIKEAGISSSSRPFASMHNSVDQDETQPSSNILL